MQLLSNPKSRTTDLSRKPITHIQMDIICHLNVCYLNGVLVTNRDEIMISLPGTEQSSNN